MGQGPETRLVARIRSAIDREWPDAYHVKVHGGPYQSGGLPDLAVIVDGLFIGLEVKAQRLGESEQHARDRATPRQLKRLHEIHKAGGGGAVVISVEGAMAEIRRALVQHDTYWRDVF